MTLNYRIVEPAVFEATAPRRDRRHVHPEVEELLDALAAGHCVQVRFADKREKRSIFGLLGKGAGRRGLILERRDGDDGWLYYRARPQKTGATEPQGRRPGESIVRPAGPDARQRQRSWTTR